MQLDGAGGARSFVLLVDDEARNRSMIRELLELDGYDVGEATNGHEALMALQDQPADVIILDIMMPEVDGIEACRRLKANSATAHIPVILVTAHHSREERIKGMKAGANDFLTKPVDLTDLRLRVRNAAAMKRLYDQVQTEYRRAVKLEALRDNLVHMIAHDLRSPLTSMRTNLQLVEMEATGKLEGTLIECIGDAIHSTRVLTDMITNMLDVSRLEKGEMPINRALCEVDKLIRDALMLLRGRAKRAVIRNGAAESVTVDCDAGLTRRVIVNLISNALDYSPEDEAVEVEFGKANGAVRVSVRDRGPGIPEGFEDKIFEKFAQVEANRSEKTGSSGVGLAFCKLAIEAHGGRIGVDSVEGAGSTFWFELPGDR